ncbi:MAG: hypothetical protein JWR68_3021 [Polaromonas sp.]|nr:hypothetical protein [Polaromonas sp.]
MASASSGQFAACPLQPATVAVDQNDGHFPLQNEVAGLIVADIASFLVVGKTAAANGRSRDAETAFLMACRVADNLKGADSVESADAKFQLGGHYAQLALAAGSVGAANRAELLRRAELLYADSLQAYRARYSEGHEKSRSAAEGLAAVRQTLAQAQLMQPLPGPSSVSLPQGTSKVPLRTAENVIGPTENSATVSGLPPPTSQVRKAQVMETARTVLPEPRQPYPAARSRPSFDCTTARSATHRMVCADAELTRLDREVNRMYLRAKRLTSDPIALKRQHDQEWRRRETTCQDRDCLLRWYAQRRYQLATVIAAGGPSQPKVGRWGAFPNETADLYRGR